MSTQQKQLSSKELISKVNETLFKYKFHHQIKNINISEKSGSQSFSSWERFKEPPYGYSFSKILESKLQNYPKEKSIYFSCENQEVQLELENPKVVDLSILYFELMSLFVNDLSFAKIDERDDLLHINLYKVTLDYRSISKQVAKEMIKVSVQ